MTSSGRQCQNLESATGPILKTAFQKFKLSAFIPEYTYYNFEHPHSICTPSNQSQREHKMTKNAQQLASKRLCDMCSYIIQGQFQSSSPPLSNSIFILNSKRNRACWQLFQHLAKADNCFEKKKKTKWLVLTAQTIHLLHKWDSHFLSASLTPYSGCSVSVTLLHSMISVQRYSTGRTNNSSQLDSSPCADPERILPYHQMNSDWVISHKSVPASSQQSFQTTPFINAREASAWNQT